MAPRREPGLPILDEPPVRDALAELAAEVGRDVADVREEAAACLREIHTSHDPFALVAWTRLGRWALRSYQLKADEGALGRLRKFDSDHTLVWLPSHRSYLDGLVLPVLLQERGFSPLYLMGGINLDFWPLGSVLRRSGIVLIRRSVADDQVYRFALREYVRALVRGRASLSWMIEGGRTRTGKLRPPRYGVLRYVVDATRDEPDDRVLIVPVSIVYDQLHEVQTMAAEATGARKRSEDIGWLLRYARQQGRPLGNAYLDFGDPIPVGSRLRELDAGEGSGPSHAVERIALEVCHGINRVTPVTPTAMVTLALLAGDRALTLGEVATTLQPLAGYLEQRAWPVAGDVDLHDEAVVRHTLDELGRSGVVTCYDGGTEPVWGIGADQHLVAAFYRNTIVHVFVNRAIGELVLVGLADESPADIAGTGIQEALRLRDLLKFEFFFPRKREFVAQMRAEVALLDADWEARPRDALVWLEEARPHVAHLVLRPFLEAYLVVAERLATRHAGEGVEEQPFLDECLGVARQWSFQRVIASAESVSLELLGSALGLAAHRGLTSAGRGQDRRRKAFADELRETVNRVRTIAKVARPQ
jgi:glycerol-3-phosphate O-acyltransferase